MKEVYKERLKHLKKIVKKIAKETKKKKNMNMGNYLTMGKANKHIEDVEALNEWKNTTHKAVDFIPEDWCNTTACLGGHAAIDPVFMEQGLCAYFTCYNDTSNEAYGEIVYRGKIDDDALECFFGLTGEEENHLFGNRRFEENLWLEKIDTILKIGGRS